MLAVLAALFFLSGASALIYQVIWLRMLSLVFGVTVYAASYTAGADELRTFLGPGPVLTDDKPMLEYYLSVRAADRPLDLGALRQKERP